MTGMGVVSSLGHDANTFYANLLEGKSGVSEIENFDCKEFPTVIILQTFLYPTGFCFLTLHLTSSVSPLELTFLSLTLSSILLAEWFVSLRRVAILIMYFITEGYYHGSNHK